MSRGGDDDIQAVLRADEVLVASGWAESPSFRPGFSTLAPIGLLLRIGYALLDRKRAAALRSTSADQGLPLDRHMAVALTSHRLLIWRASRYPRRRRTFLAGIPLDTIAQVAIPYSSSGPRKTILLQRHDGLTVRFRIDSGIAETLEHNFRAT